MKKNILSWSGILKEIQKALGNDIYESWIKKILLKKEYNHYIVLSAPTRFVRDWIVSRYADKMLDIIKKYKNTIQRLEFSIDEQDISHEQKNFNRSIKLKKYFKC